MIPVSTFSGKHVALFGLGASGVAAARALSAGGAKVSAWDDLADRVAGAKAKGIDTQDLQSADWKQFSALILAPGVPLTHPVPHWTVDKAREAGVEVIGDVELFCRERRRHCPDAPLIAITGTNGKSTTTALIAHLLKELDADVQMGGNIGVPVLDLEPPAPGRHYVIECSSYQIDLTPTLDPSIGIHLNLSPDHLDRHGTLEHYGAIKERLVAASQFAVVGVDDGRSAQIADRQDLASKPLLRVSARHELPDGLYARGGKLFEAHGGAQTSLADFNGIDSLRGAHNGQNAAAAVGALRVLGFDSNKIVSALASFPGLPHRMEVVARAGRVLFINDSKATNADSAERALASYDRIYWIAGGRAKSGGITSLAEHFGKIAKAYLIGEAAEDFAAALEGKAEVVMSRTLDRAVLAAAADAQTDGAPESAVLLSPACASFDQFPDFEKRGEAFSAAVRSLDMVRKNSEVA